MSDFPFVTVILPVFNEAAYIGRCLHAVQAQDYPTDQMEILVVDGLSTDNTRQIVAQLAETDPRIRLLDNPAKIVPTAMNIGIRQARGEIIVRVDGHCEIVPNYISRCVRLLYERHVACVGGVIQTIGVGLVGEAISIAQSSFFGVGGASFRNPDIVGAHFVDTVAFGAYRASVFEEIGLFDEELACNEDDEFNFRLIQNGGKILMSPDIQAVYYSRRTFSKLWQQYYRYGYWKVRVIQKRQGIASWRHLAPGAFVLSTLISPLLWRITKNRLWLLIVILPYALANLLASILAAKKHGWRYLPCLPIAFVILHWAYGLGFLAGIAWFVILPPQKKLDHD